MAEFAAVGTDASSEREITLTSKDGEEFKVSLKIAKLSGLISSMITEEDDDENTIPLPNVEGSDLARVLQFCSQYVKEPMTEFQKPLQDADLGVLVQTWYADFIENTNNDILFKLTLAANYLDIKPLLDLCCARIASFIKGKTPEEIRTNLGIVVDFTPEEEAQVRAENCWADDLH
jgi:S-phase kinase-associated protein 1